MGGFFKKNCGYIYIYIYVDAITGVDFVLLYPTGLEVEVFGMFRGGWQLIWRAVRVMNRKVASIDQCHVPCNKLSTNLLIYFDYYW